MIVSQRTARMFREYGFVTLEPLTNWLVTKRERLPSTSEILRVMAGNPLHYPPLIARRVLPSGWVEVERGKFEKVNCPDTFGRTDIGTTQFTATCNYIRTLIATPASAGTATTISAYLLCGSGKYSKSALYRGSDGVLMGSTDAVIGVWPEVSQWYTFTFTSPPTIATVAYDISHWHQDVNSYHYYDTLANAGRYQSIVYNEWPDPFVSGGFLARNWSIYCDYTPAVGGGGGGQATSRKVIEAILVDN